MTTSSAIPTTINPDLLKERKAASFDTEEFATWWHGGAEKIKFKHELENIFYKDLKDNDFSLDYQSHEQDVASSIKAAIEVAKKLRNLQKERNPGGTDYWPELYTSSMLWGATPIGNPFGVQFGMMVPALKTQGTDEQYEKYGKRAENFEVSGAYAQTELGHGTFLRGLETRADYDRKTEEFVLNTPKISSYKWWPGGLGHTCNHCIVVAQLYIDNKPKGIEMFYVQVRDEDTHMPLPGVDIGEIGKKIGFRGVSNGFLGLKNVRIPRINMLMRNDKVLADGTFVKSPGSVLTYFTMVYVRCVIGYDNSTLLGMASTISTRYSAVRRQSPINPNEPEPQIMDHVTQQLKLFPEIATSIALKFSADYLWTLYTQTKVDIERGELSRLPELHSLSCCLKVLSSEDATAGVERLRLACGGHGYLTASNLGPLYFAATASCTYEGENTVLSLQVGRFLMKSWRAVLTGKQLPSTAAYLTEMSKMKGFPKWSGTWECIVKAIQYAATNKIRIAFENLSQRIKSGKSEEEAANHTGIEYVKAAELHGRAFICSTFLEQVTGHSSVQRSAALNRVLQNLLELYLVQTALRYMSDILHFIPLDNVELRCLQTRLEAALKAIRPDAIAICDSFDFHDRHLASVLGSYDGNVYERIFDSAKQSPLNREPVPKSFEEHLKPFLKSNM